LIDAVCSAGDFETAPRRAVLPAGLKLKDWKLKDQEGLFFRPRMRHWVSSDSLDDEKVMLSRRKPPVNDYASSPCTYFGLQPILFAARLLLSLSPSLPPSLSLTLSLLLSLSSLFSLCPSLSLIYI
jgi:hypothetical protein